MTFMKSTKRYLSIMLTALFLLTTVTSVHAQGSMIGTQDVISQEQVSVDREALKSMLSDEAVQEKWRQWAYPLIRLSSASTA